MTDVPEAHPGYLDHCMRTLMEALAEAAELSDGEGDPKELAELLRFCCALSDIIENGLRGATANAALIDTLTALRDRLNALRGLAGPAATVH